MRDEKGRRMEPRLEAVAIATTWDAMEAEEEKIEELSIWDKTLAYLIEYCKV